MLQACVATQFSVILSYCDSKSTAQRYVSQVLPLASTRAKVRHIWEDVDDDEDTAQRRAVITRREIRAAACRSPSLHCSEMFLDSLKLLPPRSARHHRGPFLQRGEGPVDGDRSENTLYLHGGKNKSVLYLGFDIVRAIFFFFTMYFMSTIL